jgi:tetratricopeptide (TPR) repeat protein
MDRANPRNLHMQGDVFREAGGLFAQAGNFDAALAAYQEAEQTWQRVLNEDPGQENLKTAIATIHGRLGDLYALSPNGSTEMKQRNLSRLETACGWYQKAAERFARESTPLEPDWVDYPRLVNAKLAACRSALTHR